MSLTRDFNEDKRFYRDFDRAKRYCYAKRPNIVHMKRIKQKPH